MHDLKVAFKKLKNTYVYSDKNGLDTVHLLISEKSSKKLLSDIPISTKKYNSGFLLNKDKFQRINLRYFGDNPYNFMFEQKNIRLKTRKSEMINNQRYFEYKATKTYAPLHYIPKRIAKKLNLPVSEVKMVELIINNKSKGIFIERERLNESFLRRNKIMPVNLYKGENYFNEKKIGLNTDLYNNPGLWTKVAEFNFLKSDNKEDLEFFLKSLNMANNSYEELRKFLSNGNKNIWSKLSIFQILNQNVISDDQHNVRLLIDPWSGKKYLIPHDVLYSYSKNVEDIVLDWSNNFVFRVINRSSEFLNEKYNNLYKTLKHDKILSKQINELEALKEKFITSEKRDIGIIQKKYYGKFKKDMDLKFQDVIDDLKIREENLISLLESKPKASWNKKETGFQININEHLPVSNLEIFFEETTPNWIVLDYNSNSIMDDEDKIFYYKDNKSFKIPITLFANRVNIKSDYKDSQSEIETTNTSFNFFTENSISPSVLKGSNKYSKKTFVLPIVNETGVVADIHNKAILNIESINETKVLSGNILINEDMIYKNEIKILPGTTFYLSAGSSIIFKKRVLAEGLKDDPIIFKKKNDDYPWGTIALQGKETSGSVFQNVNISGGSGDIIENIYYISMLSLHETKDIKLKNLYLKDNYQYDDMLHIIYSNNIDLDNISLESSKFDAIDIDISDNIKISNTKILDSGNDGIDLMESKLIAKNLKIVNSEDKGISVGENSNLVIIDSIIENNVVGIASKDGATVNIKNSDFNQNKLQLSAYKKNWRYSSPGRIRGDNMNFSADENKYMSEDKSENLNMNSNFKGK